MGKFELRSYSHAANSIFLHKCMTNQINPQTPDWRKGFCDCFSDCNNCLATYFCGPCIFGKLANLSGCGKGIMWTIILFLLSVGFYTSGALAKELSANSIQSNQLTVPGFNIFNSVCLVVGLVMALMVCCLRGK